MHTRKLDKTEEMEIQLSRRKTNNKVKDSSNQKYLLKKLIQDIDNLEKSYSNPEFRNRLLSKFPYSEYFQLQDIYEQGKKVKEKLFTTK